MKAPLLALALILAGSSVAIADDPDSGNCPAGQIEKAFHDGASISYQCLEPGAAMVDDSNVQFGGEGAENTSGGSDPPPDNP